ncbi:MAG TPA: hypothetical protein VN033_06460 [Vulgatibacter sp.]|nr:hypothetical protein [Vulgatibacter sp.]
MNPHDQGVGVDRPYARRPGAPRFWEPEPWPDARWPIPQQQGRPSVAMHGRETKPVFSTALPPRGVSGAMRRLAYRLPDHQPNRWLLLLAADRVEVWGRRLPKLIVFALPLAIGVGAWRASPALRWSPRWAAARRAPRYMGRMAARALR